MHETHEHMHETRETHEETYFDERSDRLDEFELEGALLVEQRFGELAGVVDFPNARENAARRIDFFDEVTGTLVR
jgi:hypothetical protein